MTEQRHSGAADDRRRAGQSGRKPAGRQPASGRGQGGERGGEKRRHDTQKDSRGGTRRRGVLHVEGGADNLPKWLREEIARVTRKDRLSATFSLLNTAADAFAQGRYRLAREKLLEAKSLSPRATAIRELLGLSAYRSSKWQEALRELRTYRRLTGDATHVAVEMDALRAMGRKEEVRRLWQELQTLEAAPAAMKEARVVFGSFLLDEGDALGAWSATEPHRLGATPFEEDLRQWYVAARAAAALGDTDTARRLQRAIEEHSAAFVGLDRLEAEIAAVETSR